MCEETIDIRSDDGNVWASSSDSRGRRRKSKRQSQLKKQPSVKAISVSDRIKKYEALQQKNKTMESESQVQSISVTDLKKRLRDVKGERYALNGLASQKPNKKSTEDNKYLSPVNKNAHSVNNSEYNFHQSYPDKRVGQVSSKQAYSLDIASLRQQIRAKEMSVSPDSGIRQPQTAKPTVSRAVSQNIPFSNEMMHVNIHERKGVDKEQKNIKKGYDIDSKDVSKGDVSETKTMKDMTRKLIRKMSMERMQEQEVRFYKETTGENERNNKTAPKSAPPPPPSSTFKRGDSLPPPPPVNNGNSAPSKTRSNREKNESFFRKRKKSNADKMFAEEQKLHNMTPEERKKYLGEKEELVKHDKKKADHYAKLGKAFVVKEGGNLRHSGGRGKGGKGGRGHGR